MAFIGRNSKEIRWPEIKSAAQTLRKDYKKVGAIGFCYGEFLTFPLFPSIASPQAGDNLIALSIRRSPEIGEDQWCGFNEEREHDELTLPPGGWAVFKLGAKENNNLVDCISTAHPSLLDKAEVDAVGVPVQILSPEHDQMYTEELKAYTNKVIPSLGLEYDYQYFPALAHGFAARGDPKDAAQKKGLERAKNAVVQWFNEHLHDSN